MSSTVPRTDAAPTISSQTDLMRLWQIPVFVYLNILTNLWPAVLLVVSITAMRSLCLVMSECFLNGRGQGHVSNFYVVDLENFATASRRYKGEIHNSTVVGSFMIRHLWVNGCDSIASWLCAHVYYSNAQFTPPARHDKTVSSRAVWIESRDRLAKSEQLADRSLSSRGV